MTALAHRVAKHLVLALVVGVVAVPAAFAKPPDLRSPDTRNLATPAVATATSGDLRSPDTRNLATAASSAKPTASSTTSISDARSPDTRDVARGVQAATSPVVVVQTRRASRFDWGDAGIGAGALLALALLGVGGAMFATHQRRQAGGGGGPLMH